MALDIAKKRSKNVEVCLDISGLWRSKRWANILAEQKFCPFCWCSSRTLLGCLWVQCCGIVACSSRKSRKTLFQLFSVMDWVQFCEKKKKLNERNFLLESTDGWKFLLKFPSHNIEGWLSVDFLDLIELSIFDVWAWQSSSKVLKLSSHQAMLFDFLFSPSSDLILISFSIIRSWCCQHQLACCQEQRLWRNNYGA